MKFRASVSTSTTSGRDHSPGSRTGITNRNRRRQSRPIAAIVRPPRDAISSAANTYAAISIRSVKIGGMSAAIRRLMSCRCKLTLRAWPSRCRRSRRTTALSCGVRALPQETSHSPIAAAPPLQLGDDLAQCSEGKAARALRRDAAFELRLRVPAAGEVLDDSRRLAAMQIKRLIKIDVADDRRQPSLRPDVLRQFSAQVVVEIPSGQVSEEIPRQLAVSVFGGQATKRFPNLLGCRRE